MASSEVAPSHEVELPAKVPPTGLPLTDQRSTQAPTTADHPAPADQRATHWRSGPGWAHVKAQYIRPRPTAAAADAAASGDTLSSSSSSSSAAVAVDPSSVSGAPAKRARGPRGQNQARTADELGIYAGVGKQLCRHVLQGHEERCRFGVGRCRDSHDLAAFVAARPPDLGPRCHVFELGGSCPAGLNCRFGGGHVDPATGQACEALPAERRPPPPLESLNFLRFEVSQALHRETYAFSAAPPFGSQRGKSGGGAGSGAARSAPLQTWTKGVKPAVARTVPQSRAPAVPATVPISSAGPSSSSSSATGLLGAGTVVPPRRRRPLDFARKVYVAPLTTVGNLPFRRVLKGLGCDITCGEMALAENIVAGRASEWALLRRHPSEDVFGVQLAGCHAETVARAAELIARECVVDFVDLNCGCPLDLVCNRGMGASLMAKPTRLREVVVAAARVLRDVCPLTVKMRTGLEKDREARFAHKLVAKMRLWSASGLEVAPAVTRWHAAASDVVQGDGVAGAGAGAIPGPGAGADNEDCDVAQWPLAALTVHGRTRQQRYSNSADWDYIRACVAAGAASCIPAPQLAELGRSGEGGYNLDRARVAVEWGVGAEAAAAGGLAALLGGGGGASDVQLRPAPLPVIGNGDVMSYAEWDEHLRDTGAATCLLGRGALIKPWLCTEIAEQREAWDISSGERLALLRRFCDFGLEHWGSDQSGVNHTRRFLLEWLAFLYRYVPVGLLEQGRPQRVGERCPPVVARDELEQLMASPDARDWVRISELLLGKVEADYRFVPKHKSGGVVEARDDGRPGKRQADAEGADEDADADADADEGAAEG